MFVYLKIECMRSSNAFEKCNSNSQVKMECKVLPHDFIKTVDGCAKLIQQQINHAHKSSIQIVVQISLNRKHYCWIESMCIKCCIEFVCCCSVAFRTTDTLFDLIDHVPMPVYPSQHTSLSMTAPFKSNIRMYCIKFCEVFVSPHIPCRTQMFPLFFFAIHIRLSHRFSSSNNCYRQFYCFGYFCYFK